DKALAHTALIPLGWQSPASAYGQKTVLPLDPYAAQDNRLIAGLAERKVFPSDCSPNPAQRFFRSETGEITIDGPQGRLVLDTPRQFQVWALAPSGKRLAEVSAKAGADMLDFTADVAADPAAGARMLYEIAAK